MKKIILTLSILANLSFLSAQDSIQVTYLSNEAFLVETSNKKIILDAPTPYFVSNYSIERIVNNLEPFNNVDLSLATHYDADHFDAPMLAEQMGNSPETYFIGPQEVTSMLIDEPNYPDFSSRVITITPDWYKSIDTIVNEIKIRALRLHHDVRSTENLGYIIELDGIKIFHDGDYSGDYYAAHALNMFYELDSFDLKNENIDIAFLNYYCFWDGAARQNALKNSFDAKHIVLMHIYPPGSEKSIADSAKNLIEFPPITVFEHNTDKKLFTRQADTIIVTELNTAPVLTKTIPDMRAYVGTNFNYTFPITNFSETDLGDQFTLSARLSNGDDLPNWLQFSSITQTFSGIPETTGPISVEVTANDNSFANVSDIFRINVLASASIDSKTISEITIFPNPTDGFLSLIFDINTSNEAVIDIYNFQCSLIHSEMVQNRSTILIDLSDFPKGMYFLKVNTGSEIFNKKIIKE